MDRLDVKTSKVSLASVILAGVFCVPLGLASLLMGLLDGFKTVPFGAGLMMLIFLAVLVWFGRKGHMKSVRCFSEEGLVRNDGRSFSWAELSRVVNKVMIRGYRRKISRAEIHFKNGESAWVVPIRTGN